MKPTKATELPEQYSADMLAGLDQRFAVVKEFKARLQAFCGDLGGWDTLSYAQRSLAARAIHLEALLERMEADVMAGGAVDPGIYIARINALTNLFNKLGLKRKAKEVSLQDMLRGNRETE